MSTIAVPAAAVSAAQPPTSVLPPDWTLADLLRALGDVAPDRVRLHPAPGLAVEGDVERPGNKFCELVRGTLVEKAMGWYESVIELLLGSWLVAYLERDRRGVLLSSEAALRLMPGVIRLPDLCFIGWERWNAATRVRGKTPALVPDLAVEVLSVTNTLGEMAIKLADYRRANVRLVWIIDPATRTAEVHRASGAVERVAIEGRIDGEDVLPGFGFALAELFAKADELAPPGPGA